MLDLVSFLHKLKMETMLGFSLHAPSMMKRRVFCNQMEVAAVKQDSYPTLIWLRPDRDKGEWGDSLHITNMKLNFTIRCMPPKLHYIYLSILLMAMR